MTKTFKRISEYQHRVPVRWFAIAAFAFIIAYTDGFWLSALQGAIGAVERNEPPFLRWMRDSSIMLPLIFLAIIVATLLAHRWVERSQYALVRFGAVALLMTLLSSSVGIAEAGLSSFRDYQFQSRHLELMHSYGVTAKPDAVDFSTFGTAAPLTYSVYCNLRGVAADNAVTLMQYATFISHVRAVVFLGMLLLITNLVSITTLMALLNKHLWATHAAANLRRGEANSLLATSGVLV